MIGPGRFAREFAEELVRHEEVRAVAVASRDLEKAQDFASSFGFEKAYGSYAELFADSAVEIVYIVVPHVFHAGIAEEAIRAGKAVLCEKPLTADPATTRELVSLARERGVFHYALAQKAPFSGANPAESSMNHINHVVVPIRKLRPDVPEPMAQWLMRIISRDPNNRPSHTMDALERFQRAEAGDSDGTSASPAVVAVMATGETSPLPDPTGLPTVDVVAGGGGSGPVSSAPTGAEPRRPGLHTSPQRPRPRRATAATVSPGGGFRPVDRSSLLRHPAVISDAGVVLLGILLFTLFGGSVEKEAAVVEVPSPAGMTLEEGGLGNPEFPAVEAGGGSSGAGGSDAGSVTGAKKFELPVSMRLPGAPVPAADLPVNPPFLQRFATAEGLLDRNLAPSLNNGGEIADWMNLKTRSMRHSLFPPFVDAFVERIPVSGILTIREIPELRSVTRAVSFAPRSTLVTRTGPLGLTNGFTFFLVAKLEPGTGRVVQIEPWAGGGKSRG